MKEIYVGGTPKPEKVQKKEELPVIRKQSFLSKVVEVIVSDIRSRINGTTAIVEETPAGWEDYKRFVELARGKK